MFHSSCRLLTEGPSQGCTKSRGRTHGVVFATLLVVVVVVVAKESIVSE